MMIQAVLGNPHHPEYGVATIPFPIPRDQYAHCMELLEALEIGDAIKVDCKVEEVDSFFSVLKRTEMLTVNADKAAPVFGLGYYLRCAIYHPGACRTTRGLRQPTGAVPPHRPGLRKEE